VSRIPFESNLVLELKPQLRGFFHGDEMTFTFITYGILGLIAGACLGALAVVMFKGDEE
jgi:hypothetical protein